MLADRIKETSTTTGTGTYSLAGAPSGYRSFVAGIGTGNPCFYVATMGPDWEVGIGTVTDAVTDTLSRTIILASSNANAAVNWGAGDKTIFCDAPTAALVPYRHNFTASAAPTSGDDATLGYGPGSLWHYAANFETFVCNDNGLWYSLNNLLEAMTGAASGSAPGAKFLGCGGNEYSSVIGSFGAAVRLLGQVNVTGLRNLILGGQGHVAPSGAERNTLMGTQAFSKWDAARVFGFPNGTPSYTNAGSHQRVELAWVGTTTNATATELFLADATTPANRLILPTDSFLTFSVRVAALRDDGTEGAAYEFKGAIRRDATADPVFVGGTPTATVIGEDQAAWDAALSIDTTNDALILTVTGEAAKTIRWTGVFDAVMTAFAPA